MSLFPGKVCSNIREYEEFEALYKDLSLKDKDFIESTSGCLFPCTYLEYRSTPKEMVNQDPSPPNPGLVTEKPQTTANLDCGLSLGRWSLL